MSSTLAGLSSESLTMYEAGGQAQNTLVYPSGQTRDIPGSRERFGVAKDFQPLLTSNVGEPKVVEGGRPSHRYADRGGRSFLQEPGMDDGWRRTGAGHL